MDDETKSLCTTTFISLFTCQLPRYRQVKDSSNMGNVYAAVRPRFRWRTGKCRRSVWNVWMLTYQTAGERVAMVHALVHFCCSLLLLISKKPTGFFGQLLFFLLDCGSVYLRVMKNEFVHVLPAECFCFRLIMSECPACKQSLQVDCSHFCLYKDGGWINGCLLS